MDSEEKKTFNDAIDPTIKMSQVKIATSTTKTMDNKSFAETTESRKSQARFSNGARVVFAEPASQYDDEKYKSNTELIEKSQRNDKKFHEKIEDATNISVDENFAEESTKRTATSYARIIGRMSTIEINPLEGDSSDALKEIEARTKKQRESQFELSRPPSGPLKGDDLIKFKERGSARPSSGFLGYTIEGMIAQYPHAPRSSYNGDEAESTLATPTETSAATSGGRMRFSDNVGVHSMVFDVPQTDCLPSIEATAFNVVLQEALDFLDILKNVIPARVDERWDEEYRTIDEMYGRPEEPRRIFREDMGLLPLVPTISEKIQRDRTYVYNIIKGTARDIRCLQRYDKLEIEVDDIVRRLEGEHNLEVNHEIWIAQVEQLQKLIETDKIRNEEEAKNLFISVQEMNAEVDNSMFLNRSKLDSRRSSGYVERWEEARLDQQKHRLEMKEQELNDELGNCEKMERADQIVSSEVRTFLQRNTKDIEEEIVEWTSRYNEEIERFQQEINDMKEKIELQKLELQNLSDLRDERQIFIDECNEEKEREKNELDYWEAVNNAATIVQTLWRGYMVRAQLGQYKNLFTLLKKRKKRAAAARKKKENLEKKKAAEKLGKEKNKKKT